MDCRAVSAERDGFLCWSARGRAGWFSGPDSWLFCLEIAGKHVLSLWNRGIPDSRWLGRRCLESIWWPFIGVFCESGLCAGVFQYSSGESHALSAQGDREKKVWQVLFEACPMNGNSACSWEGVSDRPAEKSLRPDLQDLP